MNNLLKSAARKHALANGIKTSTWGETDFAAYVIANNITERDNLKEASELRAVAEAGAKIVAEAPKAESKDYAPSIDEAVKALIAATAPKAAELDEKRVVELIKAHGKVRNEHVVTVKTGDTVKKVEGCHKQFPEVMAMIAAGINLCAVGPAGSGKSTIFEQAAEALGIDYYFQGAVQQEHKILGFIDANGKYQTTQFREAFENGGLFVFEEFDASSARAFLAINNATAGQWCDFPDGKIKKHENFVCVLAGNTFGTGASRQYVGRQQLDAASLDRFAFIEIGYDQDLELAMCEAVFENAESWVTRVQAFRRKVENAGIRHVVSPRASIMGSKMLKAGIAEQKCVETLLHKGLSADQIAQLK
jgi:cobaltochelatase CobS